MSLDLHHLDKLAGVHPRLIAVVTRMCEAMAILGFHLLVTDGVRTTEQQKALYAKGRTAPGSIVTQLDGERKRSNHQVKADGYGHGVDCCFLVNEKPSWAESNPWQLYGAMAKAQGLAWGGDWDRFPDKPHIELPA